jgi:hypothetical protein
MGPRYVETITYQGQPAMPRPAHVLHPFRLSAWLADAFARIGATLFYAPTQDPRDAVLKLDDVPVFFIHGLEDPLLPFEATLDVYNAKPGEKRLWLIPQAGHAQEPVLSHDGEYALQLGDFFRRVLSDDADSAAAPCPLTWTVRMQTAPGAVLCVRNPGPACLALTTVVGGRCVEIGVHWVCHQIEVPVLPWTPRSQVNCLRLFDATGAGADARVRLTARGRCYRADFQDLIRRLSRCLHEGRLKELATLLPDMPLERPEAPFDFFLAIYCVQIMQRTRYKFPHIARAAAARFVSYWHYGAPESWPHTASLWHLAASLLDKTVPPADGERQRL